MADQIAPASTLVIARVPIVDSNQMATWNFLKILQDWDTKLRNGLNSLGQVIGDIAQSTQIVGRTAIGTLLQFLDNNGMVLAGGIDFARAYINKDTDHITDGTGNPLAGGTVAYATLVASAPVGGQTIWFDGTSWLPIAIAQSLPSVPSQWVNSYDASTGLFTQSQPAFSDLLGTANVAQINVANVFTQNQEIDGTSAFPVKLSSADPGATALRLINTSNISGAWIGLVGSAGAGGAPSGSVAVTIDGTATAPIYITPGALTVAGALRAQSIVLTSAATSTTATAGGATALPATPDGYLSISINGTVFKLAYFNS